MEPSNPPPHTRTKTQPNSRKNTQKVHFCSVDSKIKPTDDDYMATFALQRSIQVNLDGQVQNFG